jgi:hypothetical protein
MKRELSSLLPKSLNNDYHGHIIAKVGFLFITIVTLIRSLIHIFAMDGGAQSIATIPLDNYSIEASATIIMMFALWGISQLLMGIVYGVVYVRYKSLIPFMYLTLIIEYALRIMVGMMKPIITVGTAPGSISNYIMVPMCLVLLYLSIKKPSST